MVRSRQVLLALLGAAAVVACLVPNVELVEELPGRGGTTTSAAGAGEGGDVTQTEGGEPARAGSTAGGEPSGGSGLGGRGGSTPAGSGPGGQGGSSPGGTSGAPSGGSGGSSPVTWAFSGQGACDAAVPPLFCDDFEVQRLSNWGAGPLWQRIQLADAPSPTRVMDTVFKEAPMSFVKPSGPFSVSFWVRFPSLTDQHFITWPLTDGNLSFGLEESSFRFQLDSSPITIAPELPKHTRGATVDTWTCVEIDVVPDGELKATVTVFGEAPFELATLGGTPTPGVDEKMLQAVPGETLTLGETSWTLGKVGVELQIDDVRVAASTQPSVCDDFVLANQ